MKNRREQFIFRGFTTPYCRHQARRAQQFLRGTREGDLPQNSTVFLGEYNQQRFLTFIEVKRAHSSPLSNGPTTDVRGTTWLRTTGAGVLPSLSDWVKISAYDTTRLLKSKSGGMTKKLDRNWQVVCLIPSHALSLQTPRREVLLTIPYAKLPT